MAISEQAVSRSARRVEPNQARRQSVSSSCPPNSRHIMKYSVAFTKDVDNLLKAHLLRADRQEDLCYALWYPGQGSNRLTALVSNPIFPTNNERYVHDNASTTGEYLGRAIQAATDSGTGIVFLHSHPVPGWQDMSSDDIA